MTHLKTIWTVVTFPIRHAVPVIAVASTGAIAVNALYFQTGEHPAPIAQSPRQTDTLVVADRATTQVPDVPPVATTPLPPSEVPLPAPRRDDPIGDKIADRIIGTDAKRARAVQTDEIAMRLLSADLDLAEIQAALQAEALYSGAIDGLMGPQTRAAMEAYVVRHELDASGPIVSVVSDHLRGRDASGTSRAEGQESRVRPSQPARPNVQISTVSPEQGEAPSEDTVRAVQRVLANNGYAPGPVDGVLTPQTRDAIRRFEADRDLPASGRIDVRLIRELEQFTGEPVV